MKALVFGSGGQLGRSLLETAPAGVEVVGVPRAACDIAQAGEVRKWIAETRPALVLNAAAYTNVDLAEKEVEVAMAINARGAANIAAEAAAIGARVVHVSTDFVFGVGSGRPWRIDDPVDPQSAYAHSKAEGERLVAQAAPDALIVRTAWVYAAQGRNFVNTMLRLMRERGEVSVVDDQIGTPTWAPSLATALWELAAHGAQGIHHFTDAGAASWYDFAVAIAEEGLRTRLLTTLPRVAPIPSSAFPTPARRPSYSLLDKTESWAILGRTAAHWHSNLKLNMDMIAAHG